MNSKSSQTTLLMSTKIRIRTILLMEKLKDNPRFAKELKIDFSTTSKE